MVARMRGDVLSERSVPGHLFVWKRGEPRLRRAGVGFADANANRRQVIQKKIHPVVGRNHDQHIGPCRVDAAAEFGTAQAEATTGGSYLYEPDEADLLNVLVPKHFQVQAYRILLESAAAEHGARMAAMDGATRNAGQLIKKVTLYYNKTRQAAITKELMDIVGGAEALQ